MYLVVGGTSGIGKATVEELIKGGQEVTVWGRSITELNTLRDLGAFTKEVDLHDSGSVELGLEEFGEVNKTKRLLGIFLCAGFGQAGALEDLPRKALEEQFAVNLFGVHQVVQALTPKLIGQNAGVILFCSSVLGEVAMKYRGAYCASKFAMEAYADVLRLELDRTGVSVKILQPGPVMTNFRSNSLKAFQRHVKQEDSRHKDRYVSLVRKLSSKTAVVPFTADSEPCGQLAAKILTGHLYSRARYRITVQAHVFPVLRKVLPTSMMDKILRSS